jgi:hypothetical protein
MLARVLTQPAMASETPCRHIHLDLVATALLPHWRPDLLVGLSYVALELLASAWGKTAR